MIISDLDDPIPVSIELVASSDALTTTNVKSRVICSVRRWHRAGLDLGVFLFVFLLLFANFDIVWIGFFRR